MKILYYFRELNTPMYKWQRIHILDELEREGHELQIYNPLDYKSVEEANQNLISVIKRFKKIDLFITCVDSSWIYKSTIEEIKKIGIPTLLVCWDNLELPFKHKEIASAFDLIWLTSVETKYLFERWGCKNIVFQTYAANPYLFTPHWKTMIPCVGFIGSPYGSRINKLNDLIRGEILCNVYSELLFTKGYNTSVGDKKLDLMDITTKAIRYLRFPIGRRVLYSMILNKLKKKDVLDDESLFLCKQHSVSDEDMCMLYSNFALSLNITELRDTYILEKPIHKIHLRTFEIPMCGGLQFASFSEELASYFVEDEEIVMYSSKEEMIDKCNFYMDPKRESIIKHIKYAARKRAEKEHTWINRFNNVIKSI